MAKKLKNELSKLTYIDNDIIRSSDAFRGLNNIQINLFLFICCLAKQQYQITKDEETNGEKTGWSDEIRIDMKEFLFGSGRRTNWNDLHQENKDFILSCFDSLQEKTFTIYKTAKRRRSEGYTKYNYIYYSHFDETNKILKISMPEQTRLFFMNYDNFFTAYEIGQIIGLKSEVSKLLYMYLRSFYDSSKKKFLPTSLTIDNFKNVVGITGKYENYYDLKRYVLIKAIEEINEKTDIIISGDYGEYKRWTENRTELTEQKKKVYMYKSMELRNDEGEVSGFTFRMSMKPKKEMGISSCNIFDDEVLEQNLKRKSIAKEFHKKKEKLERIKEF